MCCAWASTTSASVPEIAKVQGPGQSRQSMIRRVIAFTSASEARQSPEAVPSQESGIFARPGTELRSRLRGGQTWGGPRQTRDRALLPRRLGLDPPAEGSAPPPSVRDPIRCRLLSDLRPGDPHDHGQRRRGASPDAARRFFRVEYSEDDFNKFSKL